MRHLRAFLVLAEELHFGRAAKRLRIAQPAVTTAIQQLEEEVGGVLFERTRRAVALSPAGVLLRPALRDALANIEVGLRASRRAASGETGHVVIHCSAISSLTRLPEALARYRARRPDVQITVRQMGTLEQLEAVRAGRCDLAFTIMPRNVEPLHSEVVMSEPLMVVSSKHHRVARSKVVKFADVAGEPMIILPQSSEPAIADAYRSMCKQSGVEPNVAMELEQTEAILAFVAAGLGITFMPASIARFGYEGIALTPFSPSINAEATLVWDPSRLSPPAQELLAELRTSSEPKRASARR
jgi:DNA-binding transcriptional LysR family regulator